MVYPLGMKPHELVPGRLYVDRGEIVEFSRIGGTGKAIVHPPGEPDMQSSWAIDPAELLPAPVQLPLGGFED